MGWLGGGGGDNVSGAGGGSGDLTIGVGANTAGYQQGMNAAAQATNSFASAVNQNTALMVQNFAALNTAFAQFSNSWQAMNTAQQGFQAQTQNTSSAINNNLIGGFTGFAFSVNQVIQFLGNMKDVLGGVTDMALQLPSLIMSIPMNFLSQNLGMPSSPGAALDAGLNESWQLNVNTQKNMGAWRYLYGNGGNEALNAPDPVSQQLMNWTSTESYNLPYTRQDMVGAITAMGRMGMSASDVEKFLPTVADLGVLNPDRNLTQAAFAIQGAQNGYMRMLRYDYGINPKDLAPFGLDITGQDTVTNPQDLLPALQKYEQARGLSGSAKYAATETWWGSWSSFQDRMQNFLLQAGGTDLSGTVQPGSLFGNMQQGLESVTNWMDDPKHLSTITKFANTIQYDLGGGAKIAGNALLGLFQGMQQGGVGTVLFDDLNNFGAWINSPQTASALRNIGATIGQFAGSILQTGGQSLEGFISGFTGGPALDAIKTDLLGIGAWFSDPQHKADVAEFFTELGSTASDAGGFIANVAQALGGLASTTTTAVDNLMTTGFAGMIQQWMLQSEDLKTLQYDVMQNPYAPNLSLADAKLEVLEEQEILSRQGYSGDALQQQLQAWLDQEKEIENIMLNPQARQAAVTAGQTGKVKQTEEARQQAAQAKIDAAQAGAPAVLQGKGALPPNATPTAAAITAQGATDANMYVNAFHQQLQASNVGSTLVNTLAQQFTVGLQNNSGAFANAMTNAMTNIAQQVVTSVLQQMAVTTNQVARRPGGKTGALAPGVS